MATTTADAAKITIKRCFLFKVIDKAPMVNQSNIMGDPDYALAVVNCKPICTTILRRRAQTGKLRQPSMRKRCHHNFSPTGARHNRRLCCPDLGNGRDYGFTGVQPSTRRSCVVVGGNRVRSRAWPSRLAARIGALPRFPAFPATPAIGTHVRCQVAELSQPPFQPCSYTVK